MKTIPRLLIVIAVTLLASSLSFAQWTSTAPRDGACFYTDYNFRGESFCVNSGQNLNAVPSNFNDRIRSIRVFGRTQVRFYNAANFGGPSDSISRDVADLRTMPLYEDRNRNWAARISSLQVGGGGWGGGWGRGDRDHDRDRDRDHDYDRDRDRDDHRGGWRGQRQLSCSAQMGNHRQWCDTNGRINSVELISQNGKGRCELGRSYGIDDGRLWTSRGCSGTFRVR